MRVREFNEKSEISKRITEIIWKRDSRFFIKI